MEQAGTHLQTLRVLAWMGSLLGLAIRAGGMGWFFIIYLWAWLLVPTIHLMVNLEAIRSAGENPDRLRVHVIASQVLFIVAMLLQIDVGDGPVWMVGPALVGLDLDYARWSGSSDYIGQWNWLVFLPCIAVWGVLLFNAAKSPD